MILFKIVQSTTNSKILSLRRANSRSNAKTAWYLGCFWGIRQLQKLNIDWSFLKFSHLKLYTLAFLVRTARAANGKGPGIKSGMRKDTSFRRLGLERGPQADSPIVGAGGLPWLLANTCSIRREGTLTLHPPGRTRLPDRKRGFRETERRESWVWGGRMSLGHSPRSFQKYPHVYYLLNT